MIAQPILLGRGSPWPVIAATVAGIVVVALAGMWGTDLGPWYQQLRQPAWKPPDTWFGPSWTTIYFFTGTAIVLAWRAAPPGPARRAFGWACAANGVLNIAWSWFFFRLRRPDWAFAEVLLLWLSIVVLMVLAARSGLVPALLLMPYLIWVSFAAALNLAVVMMNGPF